MSKLERDFGEQIHQLERVETDLAEIRVFVAKLIKLNRHGAELDQTVEAPIMLNFIQDALRAIDHDTWHSFEALVDHTLTCPI